MHSFLPYVPLCILSTIILGGLWEVGRLVTRGVRGLNGRLDNQDKALLVINTRFDDHLKQHSGKW